MKKVFPVLLSLILTGCSLGSQIELSRNQWKWQGADVSHYRFSLYRGCICPVVETVLVEVENDEVVSMEYQSGNSMEANAREYYEKIGTMERVFSLIEEEFNGDAIEIKVTYDSTYGFPTNIFSDPNAITDNELHLTISDFQILP